MIADSAENLMLSNSWTPLRFIYLTYVTTYIAEWRQPDGRRGGSSDGGGGGGSRGGVWGGGFGEGALPRNASKGLSVWSSSLLLLVMHCCW